jgi:hypothetical protein
VVDREPLFFSFSQLVLLAGSEAVGVEEAGVPDKDPKTLLLYKGKRQAETLVFVVMCDLMCNRRLSTSRGNKRRTKKRQKKKKLVEHFVWVGVIRWCVDNILVIGEAVTSAAPITET